jgi:hypothetical protein
VVDAMIFPYMQVRVFCLHVVSRDCQNTGKARNVLNIHQKKKGHKAPFSIYLTIKRQVSRTCRVGH